MYCAQQLVSIGHMSSPLGQLRLACHEGKLLSLDFVDAGDGKCSARASAAYTHDKSPLRLQTLRLSEANGQGVMFATKAGGQVLAPDAGTLDNGQGAMGRHKQADEPKAPMCQLLRDATWDQLPVTDKSVMQQTLAQLSEYFQGNLRTFAIPLQLNGSVFQLAIWRALLDISYGASLSYGELAHKAGYDASRYGRAAGLAVGANPISIIVPCHRIVGSNRAMTGYSGGLWRKIRLLEIEGFRFQA